MAHRVTFFPGNVTAEVRDGETVLDAAVAAGVPIDSACGGEGTCGRCKVLVEGPHRAQRGRLDEASWAQGIRLACLTRPEGDVNVFVPEGSQVGAGRILTWYKEVPIKTAAPLAETMVVELGVPSLEDHLADLERLRCGLGLASADIGLQALRRLPAVLRSAQWKVMATVDRVNARIMDVRPADGRRSLGAAVDIGTTTVAVELVDLATGGTLAQASQYNRQLVAGEDVLARIAYAEERGTDRLQELVVATINQLVGELCTLDGPAGARAEEIVAVSVGANPAMVHLLLGLDPRSIRYEPYVPVAHLPPAVRAAELGLAVNAEAPVYCVPGRAAYVGGDITADVLLSGLHRGEGPSLLIDVGTNGEVVLGNRDWMVACSTSAGPAFEGGEVSCGMRAMDGAIDSVRISERDLDLTTIGRGAPRGICGSGLIDLVAQMFLRGFLDRKGRIQYEGSERARRAGQGAEFVVHRGAREIVVTDDDIASIVRTKAAIYAGCTVLLDSVDLRFEDLERVYIAGGFGGHIDIDNAQLIGLLPDLPRERFEFIGNGSLGGARMCLLSAEARAEAAAIYDRMTYLDLSSSPAFFDQYSSALFLPHTDLDRFPSVRGRLER